ncbi:protocadherin-like wing polarity protein stan [Ruditapes philippinarum]|uniref:protocadherin-like wing polarity protein stan n=1 Tax=Ruditapes philippinarum TaxID=129788 RepID=UPI00295B0F5D|nr:protocadherin-like wing polarity protein stan [Ruditapes philippinarum]
MGILLLALSIVLHSYWKYATIYAAVPVIGNLPNSTSVSEGTGTEELLYVIDVTDADGDSITCSLQAGGGSNKFNLRLSTDANPSWSLYTVHDETYDPGSQAVYTLGIDCTANGDTVSSTYTVNIVANLPPVITNLPDSVNVSTLTTSIGDNVFTVTGTDTENDQISYSRSCSPVAPACPFTILASGAIQLNADISSSTHIGYDVTVTISDDTGSGVDKILTVLYTDINNPPAIQNLGSTISVPENTALGETVVTTDCSDSDASDTLVYTMSCTPASGSTYFLINSSSGVIYTSTTSNINYEFLGGTTSFACPVTCNDGRASDTETVTLSVTNVNEAPTLSQNAYSISADEGPAGTVILAAGFNVTDEDTDDTYSFSVDCGDSTGYFSIVTGTGVLSYSTDYDVDDGTRPSSISCNVTVTDSGGITDTAPLSIIINNINDNAPVFVYTSHVWFVSLDAAVGTVVGTAAATDADIGTFGDISYT